MLRCRRCRKAVVDSTCLATEEATDESSAAICSIWHVNVDALPDWILTSVHQAQWTVGKLNCHNCGARLGGFNFISRTKCPCGRDATVHLSKSRVDRDHKHHVLIVQPRRTRLEKGRAAPPTDSEETFTGTEPDSLQLYCAAAMSHTGPEDQSSSPSENQSSPFSPLNCVSHRTSDSTLFLRGRTVSDSVAERDEETEPRGSSASPASISRRRRERNRLKDLRRKQRRRERWLHRWQEQAEGLSMSLVDSEEEDREGVTCAVCLDVFFSPYSCQPCAHVFCEPCLRTLAKYRPTNTPCPLCRTLISHADLHEELNHTVKTFFPKVYHGRQLNFRKARCAKWPLPSGRKWFRSFWGYQRHVATGEAGWTGGWLDPFTFTNTRGWLFHVGWTLAFLPLYFLVYVFFLFFKLICLLIYT